MLLLAWTLSIPSSFVPGYHHEDDDKPCGSIAPCTVLVGWYVLLLLAILKSSKIFHHTLHKKVASRPADSICNQPNGESVYSLCHFDKIANKVHQAANAKHVGKAVSCFCGSGAGRAGDAKNCLSRCVRLFLRAGPRPSTTRQEANAWGRAAGGDWICMSLLVLLGLPGAPVGQQTFFGRPPGQAQRRQNLLISLR